AHRGSQGAGQATGRGHAVGAAREISFPGRGAHRQHWPGRLQHEPVEAACPSGQGLPRHRLWRAAQSPGGDRPRSDHADQRLGSGQSCQSARAGGQYRPVRAAARDMRRPPRSGCPDWRAKRDDGLWLGVVERRCRSESAAKAALMWRRPLAWGGIGGGIAGLVVLGLLLWFRATPAERGAAAQHSLTPLVAPGLAPARTSASAGARAAIADIACWFAAPAGRSARCGILTVPERWDVAGSRPLHLRFVVFRGDAGGAADPVIYLAGGPGAPAQIDAASIGYWWDWIARAEWLRKRDLVVFDDRG